MFSATTYTIRLATAGDDDVLGRIAAIDRRPARERARAARQARRDAGVGPLACRRLGDREPLRPHGAAAGAPAHAAGAYGAPRREPSVAKRIRAALSGAAFGPPSRSAGVIPAT